MGTGYAVALDSFEAQSLAHDNVPRMVFVCESFDATAYDMREMFIQSFPAGEGEQSWTFELVVA